ncbi:MAG: hypothetical protein CMN04_08740 [Roseibacillus sp.]|nr:hypothetical protein [Roseibacillus sp.]|tara:strand:+ start:51 stop:479 length:429 start_codon:yes stop_codon:yes gene_type:complete
MAQFHRGTYKPKNPSKYAGKRPPIYRSGWELTFMRMCDNHPSVLSWASEPVRIPYRNPFTGKYTMYVPDFIMVYQNKSGRKIGELVEIKPKAQTLMEKAKTQNDKAKILLNREKWKAAGEWAKRKGLRFRIVNEDSIYSIKK